MSLKEQDNNNLICRYLSWCEKLCLSRGYSLSRRVGHCSPLQKFEERTKEVYSHSSESYSILRFRLKGIDLSLLRPLTSCSLSFSARRIFPSSPLFSRQRDLEREREKVLLCDRREESCVGERWKKKESS